MNRVAIVVILLSLPVFTQDSKKGDIKDCHMHFSHQAVVHSHGDQAMGFPQDSTTHHFRILPDGGSIAVTANDPNDKTNTTAIRSHLVQIAKMFSNGDFSTPMFIHDAIPPGVTTMKLMKSSIHYGYEEIPKGGIVRIKSDDPVSITAIHDFLRFQIREHKTGDSLEVAKP